MRTVQTQEGPVKVCVTGMTDLSRLAGDFHLEADAHGDVFAVWEDDQIQIKRMAQVACQKGVHARGSPRCHARSRMR